MAVFTGTASVTNNSANVTVSGFTLSPLAIFPGAQVSLAGSAYFLASVTNTTTLVLTRPYTGSTASGIPIEINTISENETEIVTLNTRTADLIEDLLEFDPNGQVRTFGSLDGSGGNKGVMFGTNGQPTTYPLTAFARTLLDDTDAATARTTLGANDATNLNAGLINVARIPATLTPDKALRRGNMLGVVSQSGGVPTGAAFEYGSNTNGDYIRFPDGTQICRNNLISGDAASIAAGAIFRSNTYTWAFPAAFAGGPAVTVGSRSIGIWTDCQPPTASAVGIRNYCHTSIATATDAMAIAIGRWF